MGPPHVATIRAYDRGSDTDLLLGTIDVVREGDIRSVRGPRWLILVSPPAPFQAVKFRLVGPIDIHDPQQIPSVFGALKGYLGPIW